MRQPLDLKVEHNNNQEMRTLFPRINSTGSNIRSSFAPLKVWRSFSAQWVFIYLYATRAGGGTNELECQSYPRRIFLNNKLLPGRSGLSHQSSFFEATRWTK